MTLEEFQALSPLSDSFPLVFANGARWDAFVGHCDRCARSIDAVNMKGSAPAWRSKLGPVVYDVRALGYCPECCLLTPFRYRMHDDMSMTGLKDGKWCRWSSPVGESRVRRFLSVFFR